MNKFDPAELSTLKLIEVLRYSVFELSLRRETDRPIVRDKVTSIYEDLATVSEVLRERTKEQPNGGR